MSNELYLEFHIAYADKKDKEVKKKDKGRGRGVARWGITTFVLLF